MNETTIYSMLRFENNEEDEKLAMSRFGPKSQRATSHRNRIDKKKLTLQIYGQHRAGSSLRTHSHQIGKMR